MTGMDTPRVTGSGRVTNVRLAELIASLSLATDLGLGQPQEHVLRQTVIAHRVAELAGFTQDEKAAVFYVSLLAWVGCVGDSHELSRWFEDDTRLRADSFTVDRAGMPMMRFLIGHLAGRGSFQRISMVGRFMAGGFRDVMQSSFAHCQVTGDIADRLGLMPVVRRALRQALERWDGKGGPERVAGEHIERVMRAVHIGTEAEVFGRVAGVDGTLDMLRDRRGSEFDPALVDLCAAHAQQVFGALDEVDSWTTVIEGCAPLDRYLDEAELQATLNTMADYTDVKSPWFLGHSRAVAALASDAAGRAGLGATEVEAVGRAALVCRLGAIGVSTGIWNRSGPLSAAEWERVRTVPYLTERILSRPAALAAIGGVAAMFHERMDGSGYPRGLAGSAIPPAARVLAAAEVYQALREARPHRAALSPAEAQAALLADVAAGQLDGPAVQAVLAAAGHRTRRRPSMVAGLTPREVDVLGLLVRGRSNKEVAAELCVSARTVGTHIEHIYTKIGVTTRGAAAMYALRHGLVDATPVEPEVPGKIG